MESDFTNLYASAENNVKGVEQVISDLRAQIDSTIVALNEMGMKNQMQLGDLQPSSLGDVDASQEETIMLEVSARKELALAIENQLSGLSSLGDELLKYSQKVQQGKEKQKGFDLGLKSVSEQLDGVSGLFAVASGTMELFGGKSEFLQQTMQKVQTAIAITNGLQAVSTALTKEAAFQQNVFGKIKLWWRGITLQAAAAQGVETVTAEVGTVANLGLAGAFRAVGLAIKSIPVFGWIAAGISALIGVISYFSSSTNEQIEKQDNLAKSMNDFSNSVQNSAAKPIASMEILSNRFKALGGDMDAQKKFLADNKSVFDELGLSINNVSDAQKRLIDNKDQFVAAQIAKATSLAYMSKVEEEAKLYVDAQTASNFWKKAAEIRSNDPKTHKEYMQKSAEYGKKAANAQTNMRRYTTLGTSQSALYDQLMPKSEPTKTPSKNTLTDKQKQQLPQQKPLSRQSLDEKRATEDFWNEIRQEEINAMNNSSKKTLEQMELNHEMQLQAIDREKEDLLQKRKEKAAAEFNVAEEDLQSKNANYVKKTFDDSQMTLNDTENTQFDAKYKVIIDRQAQERQTAMNEALAAYGSYEEKRQAIIALGEAKKKGLPEAEQAAVDKQTDESLITLEKEINKKKDMFVALFGDMRGKSIAEMRKITDGAQKTLDFVKDGEWDAEKGKNLGIGENTFNQLKGSSEDIEKTQNDIDALESQVNQCDTSFNKMGIGFDKLFKSSSDPKKLSESLSLIESGLNEAMQAGQFLSSSLSSLGDAFGSKALGGAAEGINVAMDAASSAMSGAKAGAMFGPWGAAAGAAIGLVSSLGSSLAKLHDAKHEKNIQKIQDQIEVLEKTYGNLGESLEKAYSADASKLIDQQNTLLAQQKVLIQNQIAEEQSKKKSDKGRIEEWQNQIEEIDKQIAGNKEKQIDAILGSDVKSAIDDFAQAYADAWAAGDDRAKSSKDLVKQMIKQMVLEAIKATTSQPMEALRQKLAGFFSDGVISAWEREQIEKGAEDLTKQLDDQFGWADEYLQGDKDSSSSQDSTRGGFESMSQETGSELNGRFTALQISNEEIKNSMLLALGNMSALCTTTSDGNILLSEMRNLAVMSNSHLEDIARYTKPIMGFGEKLDKIERNTANL